MSKSSKSWNLEKFHTAKYTYGEMAAKCNMILWMESMNRKKQQRQQQNGRYELRISEQSLDLTK